MNRPMNGNSAGQCALVAAALGWIVTAVHGAEPLRLVETIPLPGVEGRIDHMAIDYDGGRLFIAALGNNTLEVVDLESKKVSQPIKSLATPQGVGIAPALNRLAVASDRDGSFRLYDSGSFQPLGAVDLKDDADNVRYDP